MTHMAVGTGTTDPAAGDTALETQVGSRKAFTTSASSSAAVVLMFVLLQLVKELERLLKLVFSMLVLVVLCCVELNLVL